MAEEWTRTTCPYCGVGCGILAKAGDDAAQGAAVRGDPDHPANFGRLCSKGSALGETLSLDDRLLYPTIAGKRASWDQALTLVAEKFGSAVETHGPDSVAFYVSGQILTEDYYVANKLMKGFIGSANIDTNSRLCMASSVAGHKRAFGSDTVPGLYEDLESADLVVLVGSNLAWCHPVLFQRLSAARDARGTKIVVIDPRRTATCEVADTHLAIAPGGDVALFNGLLAYIQKAGAVDVGYVEAHTANFSEALETASQLSLADTSRVTGIAPGMLQQFYELFASTEKTVTVYSQGVNQSSAGTDKVNAIINCHLATGRIGKPGMGPFSVTGQPNAMGGREAGGLANVLAAHMDLADSAHQRIVQSFWDAPRIASQPGLKAVDLFRAVAAGKIKALWIMGTNPVDSLPEADVVRAAIESCPFVVVSEVIAKTDTSILADVLLPSAAWGEKDGTVTNSERRISRQRGFLPLPGSAQPDWWQMAEVAKRMGFADQFSYDGPAQIFAEYAGLTGVENQGTRDFDISAYQDVDDQAYDDLEPFLWPAPADQLLSQARFFAEGGYFTPDKRARFVPTPYRAPASSISDSNPLLLNTGRLRDQWHTMTRTGKSARLASHVAEPFVDVHPADARQIGLVAAGLATVESDAGSVIVRVSVTDRQQVGTVFVPMHWTDRFATRGRIDSVVLANTDPISGQPELKYTPVHLRPFEAAWYAFAVTLIEPDLSRFEYGALARASVGYRLEAAGRDPIEKFDALVPALIGGTGDDSVEVLSYRDSTAAHLRYATFSEDRCVGLLFVAPGPVSVSRTWAVDQLNRSFVPEERLRLLAGRPGADLPDRGAIVCSCFEIGRNQIAGCGARTVAEVGQCLGAGTNCGSCRPEIGRILNATHLAEAV